MRLYTGNEALAVYDSARELFEDNTRLEPLEAEFPTFSEGIYALGSGALTLLRTDINQAGTFKGRGAFVATKGLDGAKPVYPSAGNHGRGGAVTARHLDIDAHIVVPTTAPPPKKEGLYELSDGHATIHAHGETFNEALAWAMAHPELGVIVHPFDNHNVIAGQGTVVDDLLRLAKKAPKHIVGPVGGFGLIAGVAQRFSELGNTYTQFHAIEAAGSNSLSQSLEMNRPVEVARPNPLYGGSAVRKVGNRTLQIAQMHRDRLTVHHVTDAEVKKMATQYQHDREHFLHDDIPPLEPTTLVGVTGVKQVALLYPGESITVIGTGHNDSLEKLLSS